MNNKHRYWKAFCYRLSEGVRTKGCYCHSFLAERILYSLPNINVNETLEFFKEKGGYCDCEILDVIYKIDDGVY